MKFWKCSAGVAAVVPENSSVQVSRICWMEKIREFTKLPLDLWAFVPHSALFIYIGPLEPFYLYWPIKAHHVPITEPIMSSSGDAAAVATADDDYGGDGLPSTVVGLLLLSGWDRSFSSEVRMGNFTVSGVHLMIAFSPFLVVTGAADAPSISKKVCPIRKFLPFFLFSSFNFRCFAWLRCVRMFIHDVK